MKRQILIITVLLIAVFNVSKSQSINLGNDNYIFLNSPSDYNWRIGKEPDHNISIWSYGEQNRRFRIINSANSAELFNVNLSSGNAGFSGEGWFANNSNGVLKTALNLGQNSDGWNYPSVSISTSDNGGSNFSYWTGTRWGHEFSFQRQSPTGARNIFKINGNTQGDNHFVSVISSQDQNEKVRLSADGSSFILGNVGIGNSNPQSLLDVSGQLKLGKTGLPGRIDFARSQDGSYLSYLGWTTDEIFRQYFAGGGTSYRITSWINDGVTDLVTVLNTGSVGIGTTTPGTYKLAVEGTIGARKIKITQSSWADYVFEENYKLLSLAEVEIFIKLHKHLPEVPTAQGIKENGVDVADTQVLLLKKIEELTLYVIELKKENEQLKSRVTEIEKRIK